MKKRKDKCLYCSSRACYTRIVRLETPEYDEVACPRHVLDLERHSDTKLGTKNGIMRCHISGCSKQTRGEMLSGITD